MGDPSADDEDRIAAFEALVEALDNNSFVALLTTADSQAAAASSSSSC